MYATEHTTTEERAQFEDMFAEAAAKVLNDGASVADALAALDSFTVSL